MLGYYIDEMHFKKFMKRIYQTKDMNIEARLIPEDSTKIIQIYDRNKDRLMAEYTGDGNQTTPIDETHCCGAVDFIYAENAVCPACDQGNKASEALNYALKELRKEGILTQYYMRWHGPEKGYTKEKINSRWKK